MLSEIRQRKTNTIGYHLYVESNEQNKITNKIETEVQIHGTDLKLQTGVGWNWMREGEGIRQRMYMHNQQTQMCGDGQREGGDKTREGACKGEGGMGTSVIV